MRKTIILAIFAFLAACASSNGEPRGITSAAVVDDQVVVTTINGRTGRYSISEFCSFEWIMIDQIERYSIRLSGSTQRTVYAAKVEGLSCPPIRSTGGGGGRQQSNFDKDDSPTTDTPTRGQQ